MTNLEKYNNVFITVLNVTEGMLNELAFGVSDNWDSIGQMTLVTELEDVFGFRFETEDLLEFVSYKAGIEILKKNNISL